MTPEEIAEKIEESWVGKRMYRSFIRKELTAAILDDRKRALEEAAKICWTKWPLIVCKRCQGPGSILQPITFDPRWRSATVLDLAWAIERGGCKACNGAGKLDADHRPGTIECRACEPWGSGLNPKFPLFERMPILADALMDADCNNEEILNHCRAGTHCNGCWVIDLILGGTQ